MTNLSNFENYTVFYVESFYQPELNAFIQENYLKLQDLFNEKNLNFCYLPFLLQDKAFQDTINYNRPYFKSLPKKDSIQEIYNHLISKVRVEVPMGALMLKTYGADSLRISFIEDDVISIDTFVEKRQRAVDFIKIKESEVVHFHIVSEESTHYLKQPKSYTADDAFNEEAYQLADEIRERISKLKEFGSLALIGDILEEIQRTEKKLSTLFITDDYRIFLKDYEMKEVKMAPLSKSLFFLFLNHPDGILFKELADYHDELLSIYRKLYLHDNIEFAMLSIKAMTDPLNNSVNEKCSRIRTAFIELIDEKIAENYYITGRRGEPKRIKLDRTLVEFQ